MGAILPSACVEIKNYARCHIAMLQAVEDLVNRGQRLQLDIGLDLASDGESQRFGHILARSDERTTDGDAIRDDVKERDRKFARRQTDQHASATFPGHADALFECAERGRCNQNAMSSAAGRLLDSRCRERSSLTFE